MTTTCLSRAWVSTLLLWCFHGSVAAQSVEVRVVQEETLRPVVGAVVHLLTEARTPVRSGLSDEQGRVVFPRVPPGRYAVRAEMIGMTTDESDVFASGPQGAVERELALSPRAIPLRGLSVEAGARCTVDPAEGLRTAVVWEEARKALTATSLADEQSRYRYQTLVYERDVARDTRVIERERTARRVATMRTPFRSRSAAELLERGFRERSSGTDLYYAPDAEVLLSNAFLSSHCFGVRLGEGGEREGLVGLTFEPTPDRRGFVEIAGTLWLDLATSELRWLEFRYVDLEPALVSDDVGGRVEFRRMPDGGWIIPEWWIRMPRRAVQPNLARDELREFISGYAVAGGLVLDVSGPGRPTGRVLTGAIEGVVRDSLGAARRGIRVEIVGAEQERLTDASGSFVLDGLVEGIYQVRFTDPMLEMLGFEPEPVRAAVFYGEATRMDHTMPSAAEVMRQTCAAVTTLGPEWSNLPPQAHGPGVLAGLVRDEGTGEPLADETVRVLTYRYEFAPAVRRPARYSAGSLARRTQSARRPRGEVGVSLGGVDPNEYTPIIHHGMFGWETVTDERGFYRVCRLPENQILTVIAGQERPESAGDTLRIQEGQGLAVHTVRVRR